MTDLARILAFLADVGIDAAPGEIADPFLSGIDIRDGVLVYDPDRLAWPGDLLYEAGHLAVTAPELRPTLQTVSDDPAEEMAAIAWSDAAAIAIGLDPAIVFHAAGYGGGGYWLAAAFADGGGLGTPMLGYWGMTREPGGPPRDAPDFFPAMARWLR